MISSWNSRTSSRMISEIFNILTVNDEIVGFEGAHKYHDYGRVMSIAEAMKVFEK